LALGLTVAVSAAEAVTANPDQEFLDAQAESLRVLAARFQPAAGSTDEAFRALSRFVADRGKALKTIDAKLPLTTFDGIETQDRYDDLVVRAMAPILRAAVQAAGKAPPEDDAVRFLTLLGDLPELNESPVAFMVLEYAKRAVLAAQSLEKDPEFSPETARELAVRLADRAVGIYQESHSDDLSVSFADAFRQSAVIARLRAPSDGSTYRISAERNKLNPDGSISHLYFLRSNTTYEELILEFPLRYVSKLQQVSERQKLKHTPRALHPDQGLEP